MKIRKANKAKARRDKRIAGYESASVAVKAASKRPGSLNPKKGA